MGARTTHYELPWPIGGVSDYRAFENQPTGRGQAPTCVDAENVLTYDCTTGRLRGASRWGHSRCPTVQHSGAVPIQNINHIVSSGAYFSSGGPTVRSIKRIAVSGGNVKTWSTCDGFATPTNGTGALSSTAPYVDSAILLGKLYYVDGSNYKYYDPATDTVNAWTATDGTMPVNGSHRCRLCCSWRNRLVMAGLFGDEQNWFMSRQGDPFDWDYLPATTDAQQAVAGNNALGSYSQDIINSLIPYNDDLLIFGGDHSLHQMTNDPMRGGEIDLLSDVTGMAFGKAWCKDPRGIIYFFGSRGGLYSLTPGTPPQRLTGGSIDRRLQDVDLSECVVRLAWDDRSQHVLLYITPYDGGEAIHYAFDARNDFAAWPMRFENDDHNPTFVHVLDGDAPSDRLTLLGCRDGYIRYIDEDSATDDGETIESFAWMGPVQLSQKRAFKMDELYLLLGDESGDVGFQVYAGSSAQAAFHADKPKFRGTWSALRKTAERRGAVGASLYVRLENMKCNSRWQFEACYCTMAPVGEAFGRTV